MQESENKTTIDEENNLLLNKKRKKNDGKKTSVKKLNTDKNDINELKKSLDRLIEEKEGKIKDLESIITELNEKCKEKDDKIDNLEKITKDLNNDKIIIDLQNEITKLKTEQVTINNFSTLKIGILEYNMKKIVDHIHTTVYNLINNIDNDIISYYSNNKNSNTIDDYFTSISINNDNLLSLDFDNINIDNK
ncbi:4056_t:CDS:2 [Cetraspora pellucida]|uniref:4056_t:CDS:1 n=1 Tax=Cetraspora pellucida TaxID=1433469 RepID=A0A9N9BRK8_9GLOM|nr:4056_t:CDS:2 [Cetraspora pellucida]